MRKRFWAAAAVAAGAFVLFMGIDRAWTGSFGAVLAEEPLVVAQSGEGGAILVNVQGPAEMTALQRVAEEKVAPGLRQAVREEVLAVRPVVVEAGGGTGNAEASLRQVSFEDPVTGERLSQQVYAVEGPGGAGYFSRPDVQPMLRNPRRAELFVVARNSSLYILDARRGSAEPVGSPAERKAFLETAEARTRSTGLEDHAVWAIEPMWSADGRKLAFRTNRDTLESAPNILTTWVHDLETGRETPVLRGDAAKATIPWGWTPAGEILAVRYHDTNALSPRTTLLAIGLDGRERALARNGRFVAQSPDSRFLIWKRDIPAGAEMLYLDLATGRSGPVFRDGQDGQRFLSQQVSFSGQGGRLVTDLRDAQGVQSLLTFDLRNGRSKRIALPAGQRFANWTTWAGERLVVPLRDAKGLGARTYLVDAE